MKLINPNSNALLLTSITFFQPCQPMSAGKAGEKAPFFNLHLFSNNAC
jgi:hypothetical protein